MKIYDISQEVYDCTVFPGDPKPQKEIKLRVADGDVCNLSELHMCVHNGTHVDSPFHFFDEGKTIDQMPLEAYVGKCYVTEEEGKITDEMALGILAVARKADPEAAKRILIKGKAVVSFEAAMVFAEANILLLGNESQTVGPENAPAQVHYALLGNEVTLLEGIRLAHVPEGVYLLNAAPLNLGGSDGAPCRAILLEV